MAELTPAISPEDYFNVPATFEVTSSSAAEDKQSNEALAANGDLFCFAEYDVKTNYTQDMVYCGGASPNIATALGTKITAFGNLETPALLTQMTVSFSAGIQATVSFEGHQHAVNPHVVSTLELASIAGAIPASSGLGVPDLIVAAGDISPIEGSVAFSCEHIDKVGADGGHFAGQNRTFKCELSVSYEGTVTGTTAGNWVDIKVTTSKENTDTPTSSLTAKQYFDIN